MASLATESPDMNKRKKVMQDRLKKLGDGNAVVAKAIDKNKPVNANAYDDFDIVHELVSAAYSKYAEDGGSLKQCLTDLAAAISKAADKMKDDEGAQDDTPDDEEDY